ncbi:hypothetical protein [Paracoccus salsus]|uniref:hypothetical protein n=1 Tax=Paracoccus salsus TaxID=2911061 RepID=UPI001F3E1E16|nr:hypothetical protein [Paracoccus salsus]MCF3972284.1 hypothetical protein [Paracoccus salsus]
MPRNTALALMVLPLLMAACATPQERCISRHTGEFRTVSRLLAEVEANLARGYAWEERQVVRDRYTQCRTVERDRQGEVIGVTTRGCWRDYVDTERFRVPIDPAAESRKRENLAARKAALADRALASVAACKSAFPEPQK